MKKALLVINSHSGKGSIKNKLLDIVDIFNKNQYQTIVHITQGQDDACSVVKETGANCDIVVVSGGDGTLNEVVNGLMSIAENERPQICYLPSGTTNDFASSLKISRNPIKATEKTLSGTPFRCDVGKFNSKNFIYVAAFGMFTNVSYETPQQTKNILGQMAYILEGIKQLHALPSFAMKINYNGNQIEDEFVLGIVSNSNSIAGIETTKAYKTQLNDGLFEVLLIKKPKTLAKMSNLMSKLLNQEFEDDLIHLFKTDKIEFICEETVSWTLDGEFGGAVKNAEILVEKEAIELVI